MVMEERYTPTEIKQREKSKTKSRIGSMKNLQHASICNAKDLPLGKMPHVHMPEGMPHVHVHTPDGVPHLHMPESVDKITGQLGVGGLSGHLSVPHMRLPRGHGSMAQMTPPPPAHVWIMREVDGPHAWHFGSLRSSGSRSLKSLARYQSSKSNLLRSCSPCGAGAASPMRSGNNAASPMAEQSSGNNAKGSVAFCQMLATTLRKYSMKVMTEPEDEHVRLTEGPHRHAAVRAQPNATPLHGRRRRGR